MMDGFHILLFPGVVFTVALALVVAWVDRKVTARVQWRVGPPLWQPALDLAKLMGKEATLPLGAPRWLFLGAPLAALASALLFSYMLWSANLDRAQDGLGDLIAILYLGMIPSISVMLGGLAAGSPQSVLGASREIKLFLADELVFILALMVAVIKAGGALKLAQLLNYQQNYGLVAASPSGVIALILAVLAMQAKLTLVPFDMAEAETEIMGGTLTTYAGPPLAFFKLSQWIMRAVLPLLLVHCFLGGIAFEGWRVLAGLGKLVALWVVIILIRNTSPRVRIDQAFRFFVLYGGLLGVVAVVLAMLGY